MLAAPHDLIDLIDPWRVPQPPHGEQRAADASLQRAYALRRRFQRVVGRSERLGSWQGCGLLVGILAVLLLTLWLRSWLLLAVLSAMMVALRLARFHWLANAGARETGQSDQDWARAYREMYYELTMTPLPGLIASFEDAAASGDSGAAEAQARHLIGRAARDLPEALLRAARLPDRFLLGAEQLPPEREAWAGLEPLAVWWRSQQRVDSRTAARYCAAYDYFFQPQARFHAALEQLGEPATPGVSSKAQAC